MPKPEWTARCALCAWRTWEHHMEEALDSWAAHYLERHYDDLA